MKIVHINFFLQTTLSLRGIRFSFIDISFFLSMESAETASHYLAGFSGTGRRKCGSGQIHSGGSLLHEAGTLLEGRMGAREDPQSFIDNL